MHGQAYLCSEPPRTFSQVTRDFLVPGSVAFSPSSFYSLFRPSLTPPTGRCGAVVPATAPASSTPLRGTGALRANTSPQLSAPSTPTWPSRRTACAGLRNPFPPVSEHRAHFVAHPFNNVQEDTLEKRTSQRRQLESPSN